MFASPSHHSRHFPCRAPRRFALCCLTCGVLTLAAGGPVAAQSAVDSLVAAMLTDTPIEEDLRSLTDEIGGRATGSPANAAAVEWALERFAAAGVEAHSESFTMPQLWLERSAQVGVSTADGTVHFTARAAAMPFSTASAATHAGLLDGGRGSDSDFARLGAAAVGAFVLIETDELTDIPGLFKEYADAYAVESRAIAAGVAGVVYVGSRPDDLLYRHNASRGPANDRPMLIVERDAGLRALRLLRSGLELSIDLTLDLAVGPAYETHNVIAEIAGSAVPEEFVVLGAHLDSWDLGTGALDNGCNVALVIDVARQIERLGITPRRTIRFALWNGEEQGLLGSFAYTQRHAEELDRHVMASSYDIGSGRIDGFFTNGPAQFLPLVDQALEPVAGLGPFTQIDAPIVGTDNYDFMMQGVANLVANQESANYGPNYHARSDTFDKVDLRQLKLNSAVAAAITWAFANAEIDYSRQSRAEIQQLIDATDLGDQMRMFGLWHAWLDGSRGRADQHGVAKPSDG
jgi:Zn-dependent M28 family amino/carboxypeptidase